MDETHRLRQLHHIADALAACDRIASPTEIEAARAEWERLRAPAERQGLLSLRDPDGN